MGIEQDDTFLTDVCDQLFGCFFERVYRNEQFTYMCSACEHEIDIKNWVHSEHEPDCIIPKVREHLAKHRPRCVPPVKVK